MSKTCRSSARQGWALAAIKCRPYLSRTSGADPTQPDPQQPVVYFGSFQDLLGRDAAGNIKARNRWLHAVNWDLVRVFNTEQMNQAVFAFRRYEDASLRYTGLDSHPGLTQIGLYDTVVAVD